MAKGKRRQNFDAGIETQNNCYAFKKALLYKHNNKVKNEKIKQKVSTGIFHHSFNDYDRLYERHRKNGGNNDI